MPVAYQIKDYVVTILDVSGNPTSLQGMATKIDLPTLERDYDTDKRAGYPGLINFAKTFKEMETKLGLKAISQEFCTAIATSINGEISMQVSAVAEDPATGNFLSYLVTVRGSVMGFPLGVLNAQELADFELTLRTNYISRTFGSHSMIYDPRNFKWVVNGTDYFAARRAAMGI